MSPARVGASPELDNTQRTQIERLAFRLASNLGARLMTWSVIYQLDGRDWLRVTGDYDGTRMSAAAAIPIDLTTCRPVGFRAHSLTR